VDLLEFQARDLFAKHGVPVLNVVSGSSGTASAKKHALEAIGVEVGKTPSETASLVRAAVAPD
jgi:succinyl-CoA synthetase alpha subunit